MFRCWCESVIHPTLALSHKDPTVKTPGFAGGFRGFLDKIEVYSLRKLDDIPPASRVIRCIHAKTATLRIHATCLRYDIFAFIGIRLKQ